MSNQWCFGDCHLFPFSCPVQVSAISLTAQLQNGCSGHTPPPGSTRAGKPLMGWGLERRAHQSCWTVTHGKTRPLARHSLTADSSLILLLFGFCLRKSSLYLCFKNFLDEFSKLWDCMHDYSQLCKLAYLADMLAHLNNLHSSRGGGLSWHVFHVQDQRRWWLEACRGAPATGGRAGFLSWFRWPGHELIWRTCWKYFEHYEETVLKDLIEVLMSFPTTMGVVSGQRTDFHHLQDLAESFIQEDRVWRLRLKPKVTYLMLAKN